jgi:hypothetical protein
MKVLKLKEMNYATATYYLTQKKQAMMQKLVNEFNSRLQE